MGAVPRLRTLRESRCCNRDMMDHLTLTEPCDQCEGLGHSAIGYRDCYRCDGTGRMVTIKEVTVHIPAQPEETQS